MFFDVPSEPLPYVLILSTGMTFFTPSILVTFIGLLVAYFWGGLQAVGVTVMLASLQVALSFDNAVVDASILRTMPAKWQRRFLTWGMLIAVFGVRMLLPLLIVTLSSGIPIHQVAIMAAQQPDLYALHIEAAEKEIYSFGGMYLLMLFFSFFFQGTKTFYWIEWIEKRLQKLGQLASVEVAIALGILLTVQYFLPTEHQQPVLVSGVIGVVLFLIIKGFSDLVDSESSHKKTKKGLTAFLFLEMIDMSFSLDSVIGAFAITQDIVIILVGLTVGAIVVRQLTLFLVLKNTLDDFLFLEHGAHYAIGALALLMLYALFDKVPDLLIGGLGIAIISSSILASIRVRNT